MSRGRSRGFRLATASFLVGLAGVAAACGATDWTTPAEATGYTTTPRFAETLAYARRLVAAAPRRLRLETFGKRGEGPGRADRVERRRVRSGGSAQDRPSDRPGAERHSRRGDGRQGRVTGVGARHDRHQGPRGASGAGGPRGHPRVQRRRARALRPLQPDQSERTEGGGLAHSGTQFEPQPRLHEGGRARDRKSVV